MFDQLPDSDAVLTRFNRLIGEILRGPVTRNTFQSWEVELLLDMGQCDLAGSSRRGILLRYQRAVRRRMENGDRIPMKLSTYLAEARERRLPPPGAYVPSGESRPFRSE